MIVSAPFSSTTAPVRVGGGARGAQPIRPGGAEHARELAGMRRQHRGAAQCIGVAGEGGEHVGVRHHAAARRDQQRGNAARAASAPRPGPHTQTWRRASCSSSASGASLTSRPGDAGAIDIAAAARGDRHHAGAGAPRGIGGQPRRAGHGGAAHHGDMAARIFVRLAPGSRQRPQLRQVGETWRASPVSARRRAARYRPARSRRTVPRPGSSNVPRLQAEERHGQRRLRRKATHGTSRAVQPARAHRRQPHAGPHADASATTPSTSRARPAPNTASITSSARAASPASNGADRTTPMRRGIGRVRSGARWSQRSQRNRPTLLLQQPRRDVAVAAIVARPASTSVRHGRNLCWMARATARPAFAISVGPGTPSAGEAASARAISSGLSSSDRPASERSQSGSNVTR